MIFCKLRLVFHLIEKSSDSVLIAAVVILLTRCKIYVPGFPCVNVFIVDNLTQSGVKINYSLSQAHSINIVIVIYRIFLFIIKNNF